MREAFVALLDVLSLGRFQAASSGNSTEAIALDFSAMDVLSNVPVSSTATSSLLRRLAVLEQRTGEVVAIDGRLELVVLVAAVGYLADHLIKGDQRFVAH